MSIYRWESPDERAEFHQKFNQSREQIMAKALNSRALIAECINSRENEIGSGKPTTLHADHPEGSHARNIVYNFVKGSECGNRRLPIPQFDNFRAWEQTIGHLENVGVRVFRLNDNIFLNLECVEFDQIPTNIFLSASKSNKGLKFPLIFLPKNEDVNKALFGTMGRAKGAWFLPSSGHSFSLTLKDIAMGDWTIEHTGKQTPFLLDPRRTRKLVEAAHYSAVSGNWIEFLTAIAEMTDQLTESRALELLIYLELFITDVKNYQEILKQLPPDTIEKIVNQEWIKNTDIKSRLLI